jgi:hypothetical protein
VIAGRTGLLLGVGALCLTLLSPAQARAKTAGFVATLEYEPAPSCPGAEALEAIVEARLGYAPFADGSAHHVFLSITPNGTALNGRIEWRDAQGQWTGDQSFSMASGDCLRLVRTMGLALAVQIQLLADTVAAPAVDREQAAEPKSIPQASAEAPGAHEANRSNATKPQKTPERIQETPNLAEPAPKFAQPGPAPVFAVGAGPSIGLAMTPKPILLGRIFGMIALGQTSIELAAEMSLPATTRRADGAGVSAQFRLLSAAGCQGIERWNACFVIDAGQVSLAGKDIDRPTSTHLPFVAAGARAAFIQPLGPRVFMKAHANGLLILTRWTANLDDVPVWTSPRLALTLGIDMGVHFR